LSLFLWPGIRRKTLKRQLKLLGEELKNSSSIIADFNVVKGFLNLSISESQNGLEFARRPISMRITGSCLQKRKWW
jgi:hypothetical protein